MQSEAERFMQSIENGGFKMYLQFVVDSKTQKITMAEALSRWVHPEKGILGQRAYIGEMESLGMIAIVHHLKLSVICEGVETEEQNTLVTEAECEYIQGLYYVKALPTSECEAFINAYHGKQKKGGG